ncbi:MAG: hypothetical protein ACT452_09140 [Microthrixaceae bacterium]
MALDAAHRSSIYQKLVPLLGDDDANALMSEFPAVEADQLVTKDFLRAELAVLRGELGGLRGELRGDMARLETRLTTRLGAAIGVSTAFLAALGLFT